LINGLLLIDKPAGVTSFEVVRRVRRALNVKKVGHLGTLDPFATGLLPLALGEATKLAQFLLEESKTYLATLQLGVETDTQDVTGRVVATCGPLPEAEEIHRVAGDFLGELEQTPPMYSAVHHQGERLYELARRGEEVTVPPRRVVIHQLDIQEIILPQVVIRVECSKGTYVRTLAQDLGRVLGCGAHLTALRRLAVGPFRLEEALSLEALTEMPREAWVKHLRPPAACLPRLKSVAVELAQAQRLAQGQTLPWPDNGLAEGEKVRVLAGEELVAVATVRREGPRAVLAPVRVLERSTWTGPDRAR